jgi:hypothetical protein
MLLGIKENMIEYCVSIPVLILDLPNHRNTEISLIITQFTLHDIVSHYLTIFFFHSDLLIDIEYF